MKFKNSIYILGFQALTTLSQLAYGAFTSRNVSADQFGRYATTLVVLAVFNLFFSSGFTEDVVRKHHLEINGLGSSSSKALILGGIGVSVVWLLGALLSAFLPLTVGSILFFSLIVGLTPLQNLLLGCYGQKSMFFEASLIAFVSSLVGFLIGGLCVIQAPSAASLLVSPLVYCVAFASIGLVKFRGTLLPLTFPSKAEFDFASFSSKIFYYRVLWFLNFNWVKWSLISTSSVVSLGTLNRAEVVTSVPIQQVQSSITRPFYTKAARSLKNVEAESDFKRVLTKSFGSLIFLTWTLFSIIALAMPEVTRLLLGQTWGLAAQISTALVVLGAFQIPVVVLSAVVETRSIFNTSYWAEISIWVLQTVAILGFGLLEHLDYLVLTMVSAMALRLVLYCGILIQAGLIGINSIVKWVLLSIAASAISFLLQMGIVICLEALSFDYTNQAFFASAIAGFGWLTLVLFSRTGKKLTTNLSWFVNVD